MKTELKNLPKSRIQLDIALSPAEMEVYFNSATEELSRANPIKGFRPGFAPKDAVIKEFGQEKVDRAAFDLAMREKVNKAIAEGKFNLIGEAKISKVSPKEDGGLEFTAVFSVLPQVDPGDYKKIKLPLEEVKISEEEIADVLLDIKKSRAENIAVARSAQKGDRVEIDFTVKKDGEIVEGGESKQHPMVLGEGHFISGFEDNLIGLKENETKDFSLTAPDDYHNKSLAGKKIDFSVKVNLVQERKLPELTDEFAKSLGRFSSMEDLKNNILEGVKAEKELKAKESRRGKIIEELVGNIKVELPDELIETELVKMTAELSDSLVKMNLTLENYLSHINKTPEDLKKDWIPQAEKRVKASLVLREISEREKIQPTEAEIEERLGQILKNAPPLSPGQNLDLTSLRGYVRSILRNEKVFELLESN